VVALRSSLSKLGISQSEWPQSVRSSSTQKYPKDIRNVKEVNLDAFEAMERALEDKRDGQQSKGRN